MKKTPNGMPFALKAGSRPSRPKGFQSFWDQTMAELARIDIAPEETPIPLRTTEFASLYGVRLTSIGLYRIFAYLSLPKGKGPFPSIYHLPVYGSTVEPIPQGAANEKRRRFVVLSLAARGQRNADQPFSASYPGLLTERIEDQSAYVFRGIVADCCRAVDYLLTRDEVDTERITAVGNDLAILTAALRPRIRCLVASPGPLHLAQTVSSRIRDYPLEEFNDYLRAYPRKEKKVWKTISYFEPLFFAPLVKAKTLLQCGGKGEAYGPEIVKPLAEAIGGKTELRETSHSSYKDGLFQERWLNNSLGFKDVIVPQRWQ